MSAKGDGIGRAAVAHAQVRRGCLAANGPVFARDGARLIVRGGALAAAEGRARSRNVGIALPSPDARPRPAATAPTTGRSGRCATRSPPAS